MQKAGRERPRTLHRHREKRDLGQVIRPSSKWSSSKSMKVRSISRVLPPSRTCAACISTGVSQARAPLKDHSPHPPPPPTSQSSSPFVFSLALHLLLPHWNVHPNPVTSSPNPQHLLAHWIAQRWFWVHQWFKVRIPHSESIFPWPILFSFEAGLSRKPVSGPDFTATH
jgi:hypothetical protein